MDSFPKGVVVRNCFMPQRGSGNDGSLNLARWFYAPTGRKEIAQGKAKRRPGDADAPGALSWGHGEDERLRMDLLGFRPTETFRYQCP